MRSGAITSPSGASISRTTAPWRRQISARRWPKYPITPTTTSSPGSSRFTAIVSSPDVPVPDMGIV